MKKGIIFDMDGSLLDTLEDIADSCNKTLKQYGFPVHDTDKYRYFVGKGAKTLIHNVVNEQIDENKLKEIYENYRRIYSENCMNKTKAYDGIIPMIKKVKNHGFLLGILSNKPHKVTVRLAERYFPKNTFEIIYGQKDDFPKKPNPALLLHQIEVLSLDKNDVYFVGDTDVDMQTAKNAGVKSIGVLWGFRDKKELLDNGADYIISKPSEIIDIIKENHNI